MSARFRIFAFAVGALFMFNLLMWNNIATLWSGGEAALWWTSHMTPNQAGLPGWWPSRLDTPSLDIASARWMSGGLLILSLVLFNWMGQKIFSRERVLLTLLVLSSSLLLPILGKVASADMYLFLAHFGGFLSLVLFLKQDKQQWRILSSLFLLLGLLLQPVSTLVFWGVLGTWLWWKHPKASGLQMLLLGVSAVFYVLLLWATGFLNWNPAGYVFSINTLPIGKFIGYSLLGLVPFFGYLLGGIRDNFMFLKKREEQAIIYTGGLLAGLLAFSVSWQAFLALLIAKQMTVYFKENYPFQDWVKTGAILHLLLVFAAAFLLLYNGFIYFEGEGYRAGMSISGSYWALSFVGVIGLYGMRRPLALGATLLSGLIGMSFFWMQLYPLVESKRATVITAIQEVRRLAPETKELLLLQESRHKFPNIAVYAAPVFDTVLIARDPVEFSNQLTENDRLGMAKAQSLPLLPAAISVDTLGTKAWSIWMRPSPWLILNNGPGRD